MAQRSNVPKFGNWENEDNVPYTVYFEKARKNRGGTKIVNPNDPSENPETFPDQIAPGTKPRDPIKPEPEQRESRGDSDHGQPPKSPARGGPTEPGGRGQRTPSRPTRPSTGSDHGVEQQRSPLHPQHQAKIVGAGSASPGWDGKSYDHSRGGGDHGRSRMRPTPPATRGDESPDAGAAIPKFGEWDESDPSAAEQFTGIFEKVREERIAGPGNVSGTPRHNYRGQPPPKQKRCCFL